MADHGKAAAKERTQKTFLEGLMKQAVEGIFRDLKANDPSFKYEDLVVQGVDVDFTVVEEVIPEIVEVLDEAPEEIPDAVLEDTEEPVPEPAPKSQEEIIAELMARLSALEKAE